MAKGRKTNLPAGTPLRQAFDASKVRVTRLLEESAREIAGMFYEDEWKHVEYRVRTDIFREYWPDRQAYIEACWPHWLKDARLILSQMLGDNTKSEDIKREIYEAITGGFETVTQFLPPPAILYSGKPDLTMN